MDFDSEVLRFAAKSNERIEQMFNDYFDDLAAIGVKTPKDSGVFSFEKDVPPQYREKVDQLTKSFQERLYNEIHAGVDVAYGISLEKHKSLLSALFPDGLNVHQPRRKDAREAFIAQRTKPNGRLSLSDRVWNYANQGKAEAEAAMSLAIEDGVVQGKTAAELGRSLRKYLNDPDRMYRRYHKMVVDSEGAKRDVVVWKKRVMGADGKVHFIDADLEHVGQGVYRSSRANAERCSRSEINGAYRYADYERWNDEEFVIGIKISLSNNHTVKQEMKVGKRHVTKAVPFHDICDDLQGIYPKTFKWAGWHPQCRCHATAVTASKEERLQWLAEGCPEGFFDKKYIKNAPPQMVRWLNENLDKVQRAKSLPYWIQDNLKVKNTPKGEEKIVQLFGIGMKKPAAMLMAPSKLTPLEIAAQRHAARPPQEARDIQARWNKRKNDRTKDELRSLLASVEKNEFTKQIKHDIGQLYVDKRTGLYHAGKVEDIKRRLKIAQAATERHATRDAEAIQEAWTLRNTKAHSLSEAAKKLDSTSKLDYATTSSKDAYDKLVVLVGNFKKSIPVGSDYEKYFTSVMNHVSVFKNDAGKYLKKVEELFGKFEFSGKLDELRGLKTAQLKRIPNDWRARYNYLVDKINAFDYKNGVYLDIKSEVEEAYNIYKLSTSKECVAFGLGKLSTRTPYNIFTELERLVPGISKNCPGKEFWDSLPKFYPMIADPTPNCSYFNSDLKFVVIGNPSRRSRSIYSQHCVFTHEYGHATDDMLGLRKDNQIISMFEDIKKKYKKAAKTIDFNAEAKKYFASNPCADSIEKLGIVSDLIESFTKGRKNAGYGGHGARYFSTPEYDIAEFLAHCSTLYFTDNDALKLIWRDGYDEIVKVFEHVFGKKP